MAFSGGSSGGRAGEPGRAGEAGRAGVNTGLDVHSMGDIGIGSFRGES
ncbi:hypothetical protein STTU_2415 [Streptomyces sp. Tu6071]|nr:hypothetical protein STTU_2415 [Streptomyces sp. Tu6071]